MPDADQDGADVFIDSQGESHPAADDAHEQPPVHNSVASTEMAPAVTTSKTDMAFEEAAVQRVRASLAMDSAVDSRIRMCPLFKECPYDFVEEIIGCMRKHLWRKGQQIVAEGSERQSMFFVFWGSVELSCQGEKVKELAEGDVFGEALLLDIVQEWPFSASALAPTMGCEVPRHGFVEACQEHPAAAKYFHGVFEAYARPKRDWASFRRCAALRHCSEAFLRELNEHCEHRVLFPGQRVMAEGEPSSSLVLLDSGLVGVEVARRLVREEEVPSARILLSYGEDFGLLNKVRRSVALGKADVESLQMAEELSEKPAPPVRRPSVLHSLRRDPGVEDASAETRVFEASVPEAATFGEELFLGLAEAPRSTVVAKRLCSVRLVHRPMFLNALSRHLRDKAVLDPFMQIHEEEAFPPFDAKSLPCFANSGCSDAFFSFLNAHIEERIFLPPDRIILDDFHMNIHPPLPEENASLCRLSRGRARPCLPPDKLSPTAEFGPGSIITGRVFWKLKGLIPLEVCYVSILHRGVIAKALEEFPADRDIFLPTLDQQRLSSSRKTSRRDKVAKILRERSIFAKTSQVFLNEITTYGTIRVFMPGDRIIEQGTDGTTMFILWVGIANVVLEQTEEGMDGHPTRTLTNVGALTHGSVFGELVMLGVQSQRTASIVAGTVCCTWEVEHNQILSILDRHPVERMNFLKLVEEHLGKLAAPQIIYHPLFVGFHQQSFRTLIGVNCERKLYFPGETVVREGTIGDRLYIINLGTATLQMHKQHVTQVRGGAYFGYLSLCGSSSCDRDRERFAVTVVAETMCQVLIVPRATFQHALSKYPEMKEPARRLEEEERFRVSRQRQAYLRMVHRRRKLKCIIEALRSSAAVAGGPDIVAMNALLDSTFQGWRTVTIRAAELRQADEEQRKMNAARIEAWLRRRREQLALVQPRIELKMLVDRNLKRRGPLKLAKHLPPPLPSIRLHSQSYYSTAETSESPYMSPCPLWARTPQSSRQGRWLPPIDVLAGGGSARSTGTVSVGASSSAPRSARSDGAPPGHLAAQRPPGKRLAGREGACSLSPPLGDGAATADGGAQVPQSAR